MEKSLILQNMHDERVSIGKFVKFSNRILDELKFKKKCEQEGRTVNLVEVHYKRGKGYFELLTQSLGIHSENILDLNNILDLLQRLLLDGYFDDSFHYFRSTYHLYRELSYFQEEIDENIKEKLRKKGAEVFNIHQKKGDPEILLLESPTKHLIHTILSQNSVDTYILEVLSILEERSYLDNNTDVKFLYNFLEYLLSVQLISKKDFEDISTGDTPLELSMHDFFIKYFLSGGYEEIATEYKKEINQYVQNISGLEDTSTDEIDEGIPPEHQIVSLLIPDIDILAEGGRISYSSNLKDLLNILEDEAIIGPIQIQKWKIALSLQDNTYHTHGVIIDILYNLFISKFFEDFNSLLLKVGDILMTHYNIIDCDGELKDMNISQEFYGNEGYRLGAVEKYLGTLTNQIAQEDIINIGRKEIIVENEKPDYGEENDSIDLLLLHLSKGVTILRNLDISGGELIDYDVYELILMATEFNIIDEDTTQDFIDLLDENNSNKAQIIFSIFSIFYNSSYIDDMDIPEDEKEMLKTHLQDVFYELTMLDFKQ